MLLVLPSDHHVADIRGLRSVLRRCAQVASDGALCTVGIRPTRPETGYGYLRLGESLGGKAHRVAAFVEKPDAKRAAAYLSLGNYLWNGGIFAFRADAILAEIQRQLPALHRVLEQLRPSIGTRGEAAALRRWFPKAPSISIDFGVMERAQRVACIEADVGLVRPGQLRRVARGPQGRQGGQRRRGRGRADRLPRLRGAGFERPVAVVGLRGVVVVDSGDAVLVVPRDRCQDVREVVAELRRRGPRRPAVTA